MSNGKVKTLGEQEEKILQLVVAGVVLHAMHGSSVGKTHTHEEITSRAFDAAAIFVRRAKTLELL